MTEHRTALLLAGLVVGALTTGAVLAQTPPISTDLRLETSTTVIGQPIVYPSGTPEVTVAIVTIEPGASTGWHRHEVPVIGYVLEGELTVDYGPDGTRLYRPGDALAEALGTEHDGTNTGDVPTRLLAVYLGAEGVANSTPTP
ncbi:MAG: cupin domain-containing protein [Pseudomonadota bacterium]